MGTFHEGLGELHGITVVVDTPGPRIYAGRCWECTPEGITLVDAGFAEEDKDGFVRKAARLGVWKKLDRVRIPAQDIASIRRLGEIAAEGI